MAKDNGKPRCNTALQLFSMAKDNGKTITLQQLQQNFSLWTRKRLVILPPFVWSPAIQLDLFLNLNLLIEEREEEEKRVKKEDLVQGGKKF